MTIFIATPSTRSNARRLFLSSISNALLLPTSKEKPCPLPGLLARTDLLDFEHPAIEALVAGCGWRQLPVIERIGAAYDFVRNDVAFGYNESDELPASRVLADVIGQCNTKSTLLMTYARHGSNLSGIKRWRYRSIVRHRMNRNVARIRAGAQSLYDEEHRATRQQENA